MISVTVPLAFLWAICIAEDYYYQPSNVTRSSLSGIEAYRSELTLDWLAAEDRRQRELVAAFETEASPAKSISTDCIGYARPASGKVARLILELLKNLEGDNGAIIPELVQTLVRTKLLVETSMLDAEPDLEALVKTPGVMMGEPHATFPRILAMVWMTITDPVATKKSGWCGVKKVNQYITVTKPVLIAKHMRALDTILARARFVMEEFIQHITPINIFNQQKTPKDSKMNHIITPSHRTERRLLRHSETKRPAHLVLAPARTTQLAVSLTNVIDGQDVIVKSSSPVLLKTNSPLHRVVILLALSLL